MLLKQTKEEAADEDKTLGDIGLYSDGILDAFGQNI